MSFWQKVTAFLDALEQPQWVPDCPLARAELSQARRICMDYGKFRYHLDRAIALEDAHQAAKP